MSAHLTRINDPYPTTDARRHPSQQSPHGNRKYHNPGPTTVVLDAVSLADAGGVVRREFIRACVELNKRGVTLIVLDDGKYRSGYLNTGLEHLTFDGEKTRVYRHATDRAEMVTAIEQGLGDIDASNAVFVTHDPLTLEDTIGLGCLVWLCPDKFTDRSAEAMKALFGVSA